MPRRCMSSSAPEASRAVSEPPWPSGFSMMRSGRSSTMRSSKSKLGTMPWRKKNTSSSARPKCSERWKNARVCASVASLVITYHGTRRPKRRASPRSFWAWSSKSERCVTGPDREEPLGPRVAEARGLAAGHHHGGDPARAQRRFAALAGLATSARRRRRAPAAARREPARACAGREPAARARPRSPAARQAGRSRRPARAARGAPPASRRSQKRKTWPWPWLSKRLRSVSNSGMRVGSLGTGGPPGSGGRGV